MRLVKVSRRYSNLGIERVIFVTENDVKSDDTVLEYKDWELEHGVTCVVCPDCAFTFDAVHTDPDGSYSCPLCEPQPTE
jgi:hypothetical protein